MFIIKFNNMVKNKWVWAAFAIVVAVAFGASDIFSASERSRAVETRIGRLGDKAVDPNLFELASRMIRDEDRDATARDVWVRYAALVRARELGLTVSDDLLARIIRSDPAFRGEDGEFDRGRYRSILRAQGYTPVAYQETVRAGISLRMLQGLVATGPWAAPSVVEDRARGLSDLYTLRAATFENKRDAATVELSAEEAKAFYENHQDLYRLPEYRSAVWVSFPSSEFPQETAVEDDDVFAYYDEHIADFKTKDADGNETERPLDEVRPEIEKALAAVSAREAAYRAAAEFADRFWDAKDQSPDSIDFEAAAAEAGRTVTTTALFAVGSVPVGVPRGQAVSDAVFALEGGSVRDMVTDAIGDETTDAPVVARLLEVVPSSVPAFDAIRDRVEKDAREDKAGRLFQSDATAMRDTFATGLGAGRTFAEIAAENGMDAGTNFVFSYLDAQAGTQVVASPRSVAQAMLQLGPGELCREGVPVPGGVLFFQVVEREPEALAVLERVRDGVRRNLSADMGDAVWRNWLSSNLDAMDPEPLTPFDAPEDEEDASAGSAD
ncbi:MAG: peptidyl-prolyl cis-trans isomerase [Kiritimatiellae bacterium]|nr:peptidyl-prolyl cis-trans isomerase [Kiritimatiellia bacterium]